MRDREPIDERWPSDKSELFQSNENETNKAITERHKTLLEYEQKKKTNRGTSTSEAITTKKERHHINTATAEHTRRTTIRGG